ncbi:unnamed protein product [Mesocestoides corti]|uniref:Uncharacterized protein n=1 Tax=Mesocestoides corti TaxID=53468 RepID=A0A0R3UGJ1_MESCO|nr:unnamed protein product [Mesocestoides corti]
MKSPCRHRWCPCLGVKLAQMVVETNSLSETAPQLFGLPASIQHPMQLLIIFVSADTCDSGLRQLLSSPRGPRPQKLAIATGHDNSLLVSHHLDQTATTMTIPFVREVNAK